MALTDEEKAQLEALNAKANEPDDDDDFDIEIWDETGAGAKVPFRKGKDWLAKFGIGVEPPAPESKPTGKAGDKGDGKDTKPGPTASKYFGKSK